MHRPIDHGPSSQEIDVKQDPLFLRVCLLNGQQSARSSTQLRRVPIPIQLQIITLSLDAQRQSRLVRAVGLNLESPRSGSSGPALQPGGHAENQESDQNNEDGRERHNKYRGPIEPPLE